MWVHNQVCLQVLLAAIWVSRCISGLVVEYIVAIDVTRARFPADASCSFRLFADRSRLVIGKVTCSHLILVAGAVCQFMLAGEPAGTQWFCRQ